MGAIMRVITSLQRTLKHIIKNLDGYLVTFLTIFFVVLDFFGDTINDSLKINAILVALGLIAFRLTRPNESAKSLDTFLNDRAGLPKLAETLQQTEELWIYAPSAANFLRGDNLGLIRRHILDNPKGHLRVLMQNPNEQEALHILINHLDKGLVEQDYQAMPDEIKSTLNQLHSLQTRGNKGKLSYGFLNYGLGFSIVIFNPHKVTGFVILEIHGFMNQDTNARMHIRIERQESETWFNYWLDQMRDMWENATEKYEKESA